MSYNPGCLAVLQSFDFLPIFVVENEPVGAWWDLVPVRYEVSIRSATSGRLSSSDGDYSVLDVICGRVLEGRSVYSDADYGRPWFVRLEDERRFRLQAFFAIPGFR